MKAFICALCVFVLLGGSIVVYQIMLTSTSNEINEIADEIKHAIENKDGETATEKSKELTEKWEDIENLLMAFNDHKDINEMSQKLCELNSFGEYEDFKEMKSRIDLFVHLFNYAVDSTKPTLANIF